MKPEDACGGGCVTPSSGTALLRGAGLGLEALYREKHSASLLPKVGGETQPKQPAVELLPSLPFTTLPSTATWSTATRAGFAAGSLAPDFLTPSFDPEEGGNFCDFQLCTGPRCPGTTVVIESRWPLAVNAKLCIENLCKSVQWIIDLCE